jgi:hypothetical protein
MYYTYTIQAGRGYIVPVSYGLANDALAVSILMKYDTNINQTA